MNAEPIVHGIDRVTQNHLCGVGPGIGTDARNPGMEITCPLCRVVMGGGVIEDEALEQALVAYDEEGQLFGTSGAGAFFLAKHLLASDWLADQLRATKAEGLRQAADDMENDWAEAWGGDSYWMTTGTKVAELVAGTLRAMASEIES